MTEERSADVIIQIAKPVLEQKKLYLITKRAFDIVCSFLGLLILAIPMIIIALIITLDSPGPPIFKQERLGLHGKPFMIYKFRSILNAMEGHPNRTDGAYCSVPVSHPVTLGEIVRLLRTFREQPQTLLLPEIPDGSFAKKLYSTYLSYLPPEKIAFPLKMNVDERGSFTELLKTASCGQVSVNIIRPGVTKGQHWHNSKWEFFIVVAGHGLIQERQIGSDEKIEFEVSGDRIQAVHMLPGYTHNIINLSETENLVTVMWANEQFDPSHPDTYFEEV